MWLLMAALSAVFAGATSILAKCGIRNGPVSVVVPIDKLSILISVAFSSIVFRERLTRKAAAGLALMVIGTVSMAIFA